MVPPDVTFNERMTIGLGDHRLTLLYAGPAHSSSDIMMMVEPDGVLFAGDIVQNGRIPFMNSDDVSTTQWLRALDEVAKLDPQFIVPGPWPDVDPSQAGDRLYPRLHPVSAGQDDRRRPEPNRFRHRLGEADWSKYLDMPAFSSNNRGNAYRIYLELEQSQFKADKP